MGIRTDLAIELREQTDETDGINLKTYDDEHLKVTHIKVTNDTGSKAIGKPIGTYINIDVPDLALHGGDYRLLEDLLLKELNTFSFAKNNILVVGLGNRNVTPDTLGPASADRILATRHLSKELREQTGLLGLKDVSVILPGVLGQTGIETLEIIKGIVENLKIEGVILIDAFAAGEITRLGTTIQLSDTGLSPGSGVGNNRKEISPATLKIPVLSIGVPTCVDAATLAKSFTGAPLKKGTEQMIVTPREIDLLIDRAASVLSKSINRYLQPDTERDLLLSIV